MKGFKDIMLLIAASLIGLSLGNYAFGIVEPRENITIVVGEEKVKDAGLPLKTIDQLQYEAEKICGKPAKPELGDEVVAAIKWVDGTVIDSVRKVIRR